jgi:Ca2+-binding RTX toxin-like protein
MPLMGGKRLRRGALGVVLLGTSLAILMASPAAAAFTITVDKSAAPASLPEPGGTFTFTVKITNDPTSQEGVTILSVKDNIYGDVDLATYPNSTCDDLIGDLLATGGNATCTFTGSFTGNAGASQTDIVTATAKGLVSMALGTGMDDATVSISGLTTQASAGVTRATAPITDTATLTGFGTPTGTITFRLFGPDDLNCTGAVAFTSIKTVNGNGNYTSDGFVPTASGRYRWTAAYSGDADDPAVSTACNDPNESVDVSPNTADLVALAQTFPQGNQQPGAAANVECDGQAATIIGSSGNDEITGTPAADVIVARSGNDLVRGLRGNDTLCGNSGNDKILGGRGHDDLFGHSGNDILRGGAGRDRLDGGSGNNILRGGRRL